MPATRRRPALRQRKSPRQERSRQTVEAILQASAYILRKHGYDALTTNKIAERAGVNIASLYQYFPNKESILVELLRRHAEEQRRAALATVRTQRGRGLDRTVRRLLEGIVAAHAVDPELHRIFTTEAARLRLPPIETELDAGIADEVAQWVAQARARRPHADLAMWITQTAVHAVIHAAFVDRPADAVRPAFVDELTRLVVRYLR